MNPLSPLLQLFKMTEEGLTEATHWSAICSGMSKMEWGLTVFGRTFHLFTIESVLGSTFNPSDGVVVEPRGGIGTGWVRDDKVVVGVFRTTIGLYSPLAMLERRHRVQEDSHRSW